MLSLRPQLAGVAAGILSLALSAAADELDEVEVLLDAATSFEPYLLEYGMTVINASISPSTDVDTATFCASGGETVEICLDAIGACTHWDPFIRVFDASNTLVGSGSCTTDCTFGPSSCSVCVVLPDLPAGCYTIVISDIGIDQPGSYQLHIEETLPSRRIPVLPYGFARPVTLEPTTDNDWFRFFGKGGSTVELQVDQVGPCTHVDPRSTLYAPDGSTVDNGACNTDCTFGPSTCSISRSVVLPMDGVYTLRLRDGGEDHVGSMMVAVQCLFGCPPLNQFIVRNGSDVNPATYEVVFPTVLGECWTAEVDTSDHAGAIVSGVLLTLGGPPTAPIPTRFGEFLLDSANPKLCSSVVMIPASGKARHTGSIPPDVALSGLLVSTQAVSIGAGQARLRNAIDYIVGY